VRRVLAQILAQRSVLLGPAAAKLPPGGGGRGIRPRLRVHTDTTPHHLLFELGAPEAGDTSESAQAVSEWGLGGFGGGGQGTLGGVRRGGGLPAIARLHLSSQQAASDAVDVVFSRSGH
jgi:hypothetical protein